MPHEAGHIATQQIPAVQLPVGVVPNPQSGASKDQKTIKGSTSLFAIGSIKKSFDTHSFLSPFA